MDKHYKLLIFTKDENLGALLKECLKTDQFDTEAFTQTDEAYEQFSSVGFDFCILDVSPNKEGISLAHAFKEINDNIRLIFLLSQDNIEDITEAYNAGADDVLRKPFSIEVLKARIDAVMRRAIWEEHKPAITYQFGVFIFKPHQQSISVNGEPKKLTTKESELLHLLCEHANELVDRATALQQIWKSESYFNARSMDVYITKLRHLLKADENIHIVNLHGKGYALITQ